MSGGFQDLGLQPELVKATQDMGWMLPSDVQDETIPLMLGGGDVMVVRSAACLLFQIPQDIVPRSFPGC